jgi:CheY-like chemotaxis protein
MGDSKLKILVVDDEEFLRTILTDLLNVLGYDVIQASNGDEALKIYQERKDEIGLIILDVVMPGKSGLEVLDELKKLNRDIKVILSSGVISEKRIDDVVASSQNVEFIQKPYNLIEIRKAIENLLK